MSRSDVGALLDVARPPRRRSIYQQIDTLCFQATDSDFSQSVGAISERRRLIATPGLDSPRIFFIAEVMPIRISAVLLAAGQSSRMGRDKALLETENRVLWERQRDVLVATGAAEVFLSARPEQAWAKNPRGFTAVLHDANPLCGPLAGIIAALERSSSSHLAVLAIDLPRMTAEWFESLLAHCTPAAGAVARAESFFEPLAAIYPREFLPLAWEAMAGARYGLQPLITQAVSQRMMNGVEIGETEKRWFENWNDLAQ